MISVNDFDLGPYDLNGEEVAIEVQERLEPNRAEMSNLLGELVAIESSSDDPAGLAMLADRLEELLGEFGGLTRYKGPRGESRHLLLTVEGNDPRLPAAVVLGHLDTVWQRGTLDRMPFSVSDRGVATGPGSFDMKGGIVVLYWALRELRAIDRQPRRRLQVLLTCDEEAGSPTSRPIIKTAASNAAAAFVLEPPLPGGALKTARKGTSHYRLRVQGLAAHAGIEPERGASAIVELAHQIGAMDALSDTAKGTTVNVGVVHGGTRSNVVAADAEAEIEVRATSTVEADRVGRAIKTLETTVPGTRVSVLAGPSRPPMERTQASGRLFARARTIAAGLGVANLEEGSTGGASDGNLVAAMGIPTLDGLGPEGGGAHSDNEHVLLDSLPPRAALLAGLLAEV